MYLAHLSVADFRNYAAVEVALEPGVNSFIGPNGHGKTNLVEAVGYLATQSSHRVASDTPLVRHGAQRAIVRGSAVHQDRQAMIELEINPGKSNRARLNRSPVQRPREVLGVIRTVLFAPEDLSLVKGDPDTRRRFLDELLVVRAPRYAGVRQDFERVLRQRNTLLKTAGNATRGRRSRSAEQDEAGSSGGALATLDVWDAQLARTGAELLAARLRLVADLRPPVAKAYSEVAPGAGDAEIVYRSSCELGGVGSVGSVGSTGDPADTGGTGGTGETAGRNDVDMLEAVLAAEIERRRPDELERGVSLVGPHRDDLGLQLGDLPAKGYASHGESWSFALALRLAAYDLLCADGAEPILILDDVFAELDSGRRARLVDRVATAEQALITAAVADDVPTELGGVRYDVSEQEVRRVT